MAIWNLFTNNDTASPSAYEQGMQAEQRACNYLKKQGLKIITRNYTCRGGELDIIARHGKVLVFVEVRMRKNSQFGGALASVTPTKQRHLRHAAYTYLQQQGINSARTQMRFDIIAFEQQPDQIRWIQNAFGE
ncbi:YraN family protein [Celerinatantimonas yamalensis]|uniref:UPF0102 protein ABUE30_16995 n=1 Tax=Celerinatantimonas yamalensis TaxID=559956 RepID=A0ABW9GAK0_9GAMM